MDLYLDPTGALVPLRAIAPMARKKIRAALRLLPDDPSGRTNGLAVKRLVTPGQPPAYRLRVGDWRAGFLIDGERILVLQVFHRSEGYGWLDRLYS